MNRNISNTPQIFDSHFHIIDYDFPLYENNGFIPEEYSCEMYLERLQGYNLIGGALVSGSFQRFDQTFLLAALRKLGPGFVGIAQIPHTISDEEIIFLQQNGIRGVRFNLRRGGSEDLDHLQELALRVYRLVHWHTELYCESTVLQEHMDMLRPLPALCIDHLGLRKDGLQAIYTLAEHGVHIKATGFGRVDFDVEPVLRRIFDINPQALLFGTDLPSTRVKHKYEDSHYLKIHELFNEDEADMILSKNATTLYLSSR